MKILLLALALTFPTIVWAACPAGQIPGMDRFGNQTCQRSDGSTASVNTAPGQQCPNGSHPEVDNYGNNTCRSDDGRQRYYDTSQGCPAGFIPWPDQYGRMGCKRI